MGRRLLTGLVAFAMVLVGMPLGAGSALAAGTVSLTSIGVAYTQDFDTLATTGTTNTLLPPGWTLAESGTSSRVNGAYAAGTGTDTTGDTYSFGSSGSTERAFGTLLSGTITPTIGASFTNDTGATITRLDISYIGEQWRLGASGRGADRLDFQFSTDASSLTTGTWIDADVLDFSSVVTVGTVGALNGNLAGNSAAVSGSVAVSVAAGATFWIRWTDLNVASSDDGLAIDSFALVPRESDSAPAISATSPLSGATGVATDANLTITFSEMVDVAAGWYSITCATSGPHSATATTTDSITFVLDPSSDFASLENCNVTVFAPKVTDRDTNDPPDSMVGDVTWSFTTADACGDPATYIHAVQGSALATPMNGAFVTIEGVVVGDYQGTDQFGGYYVQEEDADADGDPATSEGIFVFSSTAVAAGDVVRLSGRVAEFSGLTELTSVTRTSVCASGATVTPTTVSLPVASYTDFERYEGMLVHFDQTLTATETFTLARFGEVRLAADGRLYTPTAVTTPGAAAIALEDENQRRSFVLDDGNSKQNIDPTLYPTGGLRATNTLRSGYTVNGLDGVFDYRFGTYRLQPVEPVSFAATNPRVTAPDAVGGNTKVGSFNVLNYFNGNGTHLDGAAGGFPTSRGASSLFELNRQTAKEVSALAAIGADIVGLMEIENDGGPASALADLVAALNAAVGAGTYAYIDTGVIGTDAIKVALIYKPAAVTPVGAWKIITTAVDPRFIDTKNRPSLAQTFQRNGTTEKVTVVVNHLKSKGSSCDDVADPDTGDGQGNCNLTRARAAAAIVDWLATDPTASGSPNFLLIGDMNSYTFEDPITTFTSAGYANLVHSFDGLGAYSYVFNGEAGYLDHALASSALAGRATGVGHWHINADEPVALDYNTEFKSANQVNTFYDAGPYRSSDHDPVVIGLDLRSTPASICALTSSLVSKPGIANSLCAKLAAAEAARDRGDENAAANLINAYLNEVRAQRGKAISAADADLLIALAGALLTH